MDIMQSLSFLRVYLFFATQNPPRSRHTSKLASLALDAVNRCEIVVLCAVGLDVAVYTRTLQEATLEFINHRGTFISKDYGPLAQLSKPVRCGDECFNCKSPVIRYRFEFLRSSVSGRLILNCPRCGVIADLPDSREKITYSVDRSGRIIEIGSLDKNEETTVLFQMECKDSTLNEVTRIGSLGRVERAIVPFPESELPGPLKLSCLVMCGVHLHVFSTYLS